MDKLLKSNWFVKIIAFLLALMLYTVLSMETQEQSDRQSLFNSVSKTSETVSGVAITPYFDENKYVLTDLPRSVDVKLTGSSNLMTKALKVDRRMEVYIDLTKMGPGTKKVPVKIRNVPENLKAVPLPREVEVTLHRKQTKQIPILVDIKNKNKLPEGYETGKLSYSPRSVYVTGPEDYIGDIASVRASVDVSNAKDKLESRLPLRAYDSQGNLLDVLIDPKSVNVTVPISKPSKTVPLTLDEKGSLPDGLTLAGITMNPQEVTLTGPSSALDKVSEVSGVNVDLDKIKEDSTIDVDVPLPEGTESVNPKQVQVKVDVENDIKTKTFKDIPIDMRGDTPEQQASFISPPNGTMDVTITGSKKAVDALAASDISAYVDVSNLESGEHTVSIKVSNSKNLQMKKEFTTAKIKIEAIQSSTDSDQQTDQSTSESGDNNGDSGNEGNTTGKPNDNQAFTQSKAEGKTESITEGEN
ncbi:CdaR family protein [Fictibacillus terranigra]|uniref:CdaR family protein n=1 Tax=Fictibacillus terranigra TaxID=3058424 RepID=A0ABT8EE50_9BACL|nr:CdaR family protein [Fictibacillus sp. CENA-BCM004]MDN4076087.1 CdaR family protein [Fictibacillus sp. CENA-BCM004]